MYIYITYLFAYFIFLQKYVDTYLDSLEFQEFCARIISETIDKTEVQGLLKASLNFRSLTLWRKSLAGISTPLKINMEHNHGGLEDHFPF